MILMGSKHSGLDVSGICDLHVTLFVVTLLWCMMIRNCVIKVQRFLGSRVLEAQLYFGNRVKTSVNVFFLPPF